jgi:hypothetical protein
LKFEVIDNTEDFETDYDEETAPVVVDDEIDNSTTISNNKIFFCNICNCNIQHKDRAKHLLAKKHLNNR